MLRSWMRVRSEIARNLRGIGERRNAPSCLPVRNVVCVVLQRVNRTRTRICSGCSVSKSRRRFCELSGNCHYRDPTKRLIYVYTRPCRVLGQLLNYSPYNTFTFQSRLASCVLWMKVCIQVTSFRYFLKAFAQNVFRAEVCIWSSSANSHILHGGSRRH